MPTAADLTRAPPARVAARPTGGAATALVERTRARTAAVEVMPRAARRPRSLSRARSTQGSVPAALKWIGAYCHPGPAYWEDPRLLRDDESAASLGEALGSHNAIVMRGNGAIVVADALEKAVVLSWFLEDAARIERDVRQIGGARQLDADEIVARQVFAGGVVERMWRWLTS